MRFEATLQANGKTATGIEVPDDVIAALVGGKRPAVAATVNGYALRITVGVMGGKSMIPFSAEHRRRSGINAGDKVEVELTLDSAPRPVEIAPDLASALDGMQGARAAFEALSNSRQRQMAGDVEAAKTSDTRQKRIDRIIASLST